MINDEAGAARQVGRVRLLRDDALEAELPRAGKELLAALLDVVHVDELRLLAQEVLQDALALGERELP